MTDALVAFPRLLALLLGGVIGSFLNVCVSRWPDGLSVITPRSRCPRCGHEITWYENIPVLSWLVLRGRCRGCHQPISPVYPLVEVVVALLWLAAVLQFGMSFTALRVAVFGTVLLGIVLTDASRYVIPDGFTVFGLIWALAAAGIGVFTGETLPFAGLYEAVVGACVGAGAIAIVGWLGELALKKEAMGFGDVTLMAMVGAHLGSTRTLLTIFLGAAIGAVGFLGIVFPLEWLRSRRRGASFDPPLVPFGVFLAPAGIVALLWGDALIDWYTHGVLGL
ncbi:MAG: prepilin peptidase [Gemmatimonadota bacterium]|nr:prepilin peptidase [Gemmatimonadota bacterium]